MKKTFYMLAVLLIAAALLAACGGGGGGASGQAGGTATTGAGASGGGTGDPKAGETLFASATIGSNPGCKTCHSLDGSKLVGPTLKGIASAAGTMVAGQSAEQYIQTSITDPNAFITPGFSEGVMPSFKTVLSDKQLSDLVAYLMTLK